MTSFVKPRVAPSSAAWPAAAELVARWFAGRERIDELLERAPPSLTGVERARCQHLVFGVVRHAGRLEAAVARLIAHPPRFVTRAVIFIAGFELIESDQAEGSTAKIVHHAVEQARTLASPAEARLVNAVLRKLALALQAETEPTRLATADVLADYYSHPAWMVQRWLVAHGADSTRALLEWNQKPAAVYARWRSPEAPPAWLKPTPWPGFFEVPSGSWSQVEPLLKAGSIYLQDPGTRLAVDLLAPKPGESVLDVCASPGGKSLLIADRMAAPPGGGKLVALDLPARMGRLRENLARAAGVEVIAAEGDIMHGAGKWLQEKNVPAAYDAVLVDVPCSNTGVMRHRIDVKWRLQEGDFSKHGRQQLALLVAAARFVAPGGRLVYSTCSVDAEENEGVAAAFLKKLSGRFSLEAQTISYPWVTGHDGAAAFLFRGGATCP